MNHTERNELARFAEAFVAKGILERGEAGMADNDRAALVERLGREAIDQAAETMVAAAVATPTAEEEAALLRHITASHLGMGALQAYLDDDSIENIDITGCDVVWISYADGTKEKAEPIAESDEALVDYCQRLVRTKNTGGERRVDSSKPMVDIHLPGGHRMSVLIEVASRPCISIRRHRFVDPTLSDLADSMSPALQAFLAAAVAARFNIIISGGPDAGKTTLLRALAAEVDPKARIITIELSYELGLHHQARHLDCPAWETREANTEGQGEITMAQLVERSKRHNPDRVIVGEVLGDEIVPMLNAMTIGKPGSMCTIHADSSEGTFNSIKSFASQSPKQLSDNATALMTAQALDLVVFCEQRPDQHGLLARYIASVRSVDGSDGEHVLSSEIFAEPPGGGPAVPHFAIPPRLRDRLGDVGYEARPHIYEGGR